MTLSVRVALTAAALLTGGAACAEAAPFTIAIGAETGADGPLQATLAGDTSSTAVTLSYYENNETATGPSFFSTTFSDTGAVLTRSNATTTTDPAGFSVNTADFEIRNTAFAYTVTNTDGSSEVRTGYLFDFTLIQQVAPDGTPYQYLSSSNKTVLGSVYDAFSSTTTVTGNPLSPVPLPPGLLLFGAALLALGTAGRVGARCL